MLDKNQLRWRCRRGVRELDVIFGRLIENEFESLAENEVRALERLLEVPDPVIMDWIFGRSISDDSEIQALVVRLKRISGLD